MCKAIDFANNINEQITQAKEYYDKLQIKEKVFNDVQQDILHKIEGLEKFSLYEGWKFCMSLSKLRKARRKTKNELATMKSLVTQLGSFEIKEKKLDRKATAMERLNFDNGYHKRQLEMTGDILKEVDTIINSVVESNHLTRTNANKILKVFKDNDSETNNIEYDENKIYEITEKIPRIKGGNVRIAFKTQEQKAHLIKYNRLSYESYYENNTERYVEFICRKTDK